MRTQLRRRAAAHGMTLIEVMVVVAILGMIAALATVIVADRLQEAKIKVTRTQLRHFRDALELFYLDNSFYPTSDQGLDALVTAPTSGRVPNKYPPNGYITGPIPKDAWGNPYEYVSPGAGHPYDIISRGRDGAAGGEGFDADISCWQTE